MKENVFNKEAFIEDVHPGSAVAGNLFPIP